VTPQNPPAVLPARAGDKAGEVVAGRPEARKAAISPVQAPDGLNRCPFCDRIAASDYDRLYKYAVTFAPLNPVVPGHLLVVSLDHVADVAASPDVTAGTFRAAARLAAETGDCNVITSKGAAATQTVGHFHVHVVPRRLGDGLALPWSGQTP